MGDVGVSMTTASCSFDAVLVSNKEFFHQVGLFQAPILTTAHKYVGMAAVFGFLFGIGHIITVLVTCITEGFGWGVNAWIFDMTGFVAGVGFAFLCQKASSTTSS